MKKLHGSIVFYKHILPQDQQNLMRMSLTEHTHELTVIGTVGTMLAQDQANQHSSQKVEREHRSYCTLTVSDGG